MPDEKYIVVFVTAETDIQAGSIARILLEKKLAACVNIISGVRSMYRWHGKIENSAEFLLIIKSKAVLFDKLAVCVKQQHSYSVPEIISIPIINGSPEYLKWLGMETL